MQSPTRPRAHQPGDSILSVYEVAEQCFHDIEVAVNGGGSVSDADLAKLSLLLGRNWAKALQLVERGAVTCYTGEASGRRAFEVAGRAARHTVLPRHYCSCQAHRYEVVSRGEAAYCKHQLAARLAWAVRACNVTPVDDALIANMLLEA